MIFAKKKKINPINNLTDEEKILAKNSYWRRNICIFLMMIPVIVWFLIFAYWPLYYLRMAFYDYKYIKGFSGSEFVGFKYFIDFFQKGGMKYVWNTLAINLLALIFLFPFFPAFDSSRSTARNHISCRSRKSPLASCCQSHISQHCRLWWYQYQNCKCLCR